ncbi:MULTISPECIES: aspartate/glutamate racemase family protein [Arthrobacter]|uniref:Aspartate/glutamate racemase family protein n=2 Tax=Arthrobacter TaxID=1663 RepID=A0ABU9KL55_9MICC|nr:aspartate/glutamate racemase family protein [Arthrobacter sp. YJM1]MDP5227630.1 aspartate/glutamate racemase family protein [Arthrobacter sp. YJM1]
MAEHSVTEPDPVGGRAPGTERRPMRLLLVNCNTSTATSERIRAVAQSVAASSTTVEVATPEFGAERVVGFYDSFISAAASLQVMARWRGRCDGVVMVGFGEHGREGARQLMDVPVVDITEAGMMAACLLGSEVGILATSDLVVGPVRESVAAMGLSSRLRGIHVAVGADPADPATFVPAAQALLAGGADVIVLAGAGLLGVQEHLSRECGVPVVDPLTTAVTWCESLAHLSLTTSKHRDFRWEPGKAASLG